MKKAVWITAIVIVCFLLSLNSALSLFPVVSYNEDFTEARITNWLGLGSELAVVTLLDNTDQCLVDCEANLRVWFSDDANKPFKKIKFKKFISGGELTYVDKEYGQEFLIHINGTFEEEVDNWEEDCNLELINGTLQEVCGWKKNGKKTIEVTKDYWEELKKTKDLDAGTYYIKIKGKKEPYEEIDWVMNIFDLDLEKMDWWNSDWLYKRNFNVTNSDGTYPIHNEEPINITNFDTATIISAGKMESDCSDIRIVCNGEEKDMNITSCNTANTNITFPLTTNTTVDTTCDMYYGNDAGVDDGSNSIIVWDDFHKVTGQWSTYTNSAGSCSNISASGIDSYEGVLGISSGNTMCYYIHNVTGNDKSMSAQLFKQGANYLNLVLDSIVDDSAKYADDGFGLEYYDAGNKIRFNRYDDGDSSDVGYTPGNDQQIWMFNISHRAGSSIILAANMTDTPAYITSTASDVTTGENGTVGIGFMSTSGDYGIEVDNICIINKDYFCFNYNEKPTYVLGGEEAGTQVTLDSPSDSYETFEQNITFDASIILSSNIVNATAYVWNNSGAEVHQNVTTDYSGNSDSASITIELIEPNLNYEWNIISCDDTNACEWAQSNRSFNVTTGINSTTYNLSAYETNEEYLAVNISGFTEKTLSNIYLVYNDTETELSKDNEINNVWYAYDGTFDIPAVVDSVSKDFHYKFIYTDDTIDYSTNYSQEIVNTNWTLCDQFTNISYLNVSFRDEVTLNHITSILDGIFYYYIGSGAYREIYDYDSVTTHNENYTFCFEPAIYDVKINVSDMEYENQTSYPLRTTNLNANYSNVTTELYLDLLSTADGEYVYIQTVTAADQAISGVAVTAEKYSGGTYTEVGSGTSDDAGITTFWLNTDYTHRFTFVKSGYDTYSVSIKPVGGQTYTITLYTETTTNITEWSRGIDYQIYPKLTGLTNNTQYAFALDIDSGYFNLQRYGFIIYNESEYYFGEASGTESSGSNVSAAITIDDSPYIIMEYYYETNDTYVNQSYTWYVGDYYEGEFSLLNFFDDLKAFIGYGGFNEFSLALIAVVAIFVITALLTYVSGNYSPVAIMSIVFFLALAADILGLFTLPNKAVPHFIPIVVGMILFGYLIYEWRG